MDEIDAIGRKRSTDESKQDHDSTLNELLVNLDGFKSTNGIFIMGATGPMDEGKRRPHIDWTHTALVQGNAIRDYVKWDYQPTSIDGVPESFARAYSIMTTQPQGPVYMCYDAALQEAPITKEVKLPPVNAVATPSPMMPDPAAIAQIADRLCAAAAQRSQPDAGHDS